jgi:uncharacterized protein with ATP-grasp and redox domains
MQTNLDCIPCFVRQAAEALVLSTEDSGLREKIFRRVLRTLADADWSDSAPAISQRLHRIIREETGNADPYLTIKDRMNRLAQEMLPRCQEFVANASDSREAIVRLAVAGNLLDSGAKTQIQPENLAQLLSGLWERPMQGDIAALFQAADRASQILYLADNAGEIVFDRLLIEALPMAKITVAVRGGAILNDALLDDAERMGITGIVPVITNGSDAPGTVIEDCSEQFREMFNHADLIISKGQGNYETLSETPAPIFFLFTTKCSLVAKRIGATVGCLIAEKSANWTEKQ